MKNVNLFPYRQEHQWQMTKAFQRAVLATALMSLVLSMGVAWAVSEGLLWSGKSKSKNGSAPTLQVEQQALMEKIYAHIESNQGLQLERQQRLVMLNLIRYLAEHPLPGVSIKHMQWADGVLQVEAWAYSDERAQAWVQHIQAARGVLSIEKIDHAIDPLAQEMSVTQVHLRLKLGGTDGPS